MILSFHRSAPAVRVLPRACYVSPPEFEPAPEKFRKPNRQGDRLRRRVLAFVRKRGTVSLGEVQKRFDQAPAVRALLSLAEMGLIDVLNEDKFRAR